MNHAKGRQGRFTKWVSGSIRRKLTLFVVMVCLVLIALVWVLATRLLEPVYYNSLRKDLEKNLATIAGILNEGTAQGIEPLQMVENADGGTSMELNSVYINLLNAAIERSDLNITERTIDIAGRELRGLVQTGYVYAGSFHSSDGVIGSAEKWLTNQVFMGSLRAEVLRNGQMYYLLANGQMVVGISAAEGQLSVIVAANTERVAQSVQALKQLMLPISLTLIFISVLAAWIFSHWFTRPISRLSRATREMAKGNYDVSVQVGGHDEITELADDFNLMAQEVKRSADMQRDLIANVSHDLRTPLTLIKGYAETVRDLTGDEPEKRTEQLNVIVDEADRLTALVGSVMELTRVSSGNEKANPVRFDVTQLCDEMAYRYDAICRQKGYHFEFKGDDPCEIYADPELVERALHNLLGNALNHVGEDGYIGLSVHPTPAGGARVEVSDHGPGIAAEDLPHLFDRYYRARADAGKPGTGLGLSITKAIFLSQGFNYGVESQLGQGATFWFEAPPPQKLLG